MNVKKVGLAFGLFLGLMHLFWSILIALGWAQGYIDFVLGMHSLSNPYVVLPFSLVRSIELVVLTSIIGYVVGSVFAIVFNKIK